MNSKTPKIGTFVLIGLGILAVSKAYKSIFGATGGFVAPPVNTSNLTYLPAWYTQQAAAIYQAVYENDWIPTPWEMDKDFRDILLMLYTGDDVLALISAYGDRGPYLWANRTLPETVQMYLDTPYKNEVNQAYLDRGISWQWA